MNRPNLVGAACGLVVFVLFVAIMNNVGAANNAPFEFNPWGAVESLAWLLKMGTEVGRSIPIPRVWGTILLVAPSVVFFFIGRAITQKSVKH